MGIFSNDESKGPAKELATAARSQTVTADRLTTTEKKLGQDHLAGNPLIKLLNDDEQPHYYFWNGSANALSRDGDNAGLTGGSYINIYLITDQRILLISKGNMGGAIPHGSVQDVETNSGSINSRLSIFTENHEYKMMISRKVDFDDIEEGSDYIRKRAAETSSNEDNFVEVRGLQHLWHSSGSDRSAEERIATDPVGTYVTEDRINKVKEILDYDEVVHYITRGTTVDVEGSSAGSSLFGDDRSRKSGTRGYVRAVVTDKRVAIKVPQVLGNDERSIPYDSITSVDLDTGLANKRISLQTAGQTYHIEAHKPGKKEVREVVSFIREKRGKANEPDVVTTESTSEPDPLDQLEKLRELHEKGAVSDSEFENKKENLLDQI